MANHLAPSHRSRAIGVACVAAGVGVMVFAITEGGRNGGFDLLTRAGQQSSTSPTVLGETITSPPRAQPATPVRLGEQPSSTTSVTSWQDGAKPKSTSTSTTPPPTLGPPWSIVNTTTSQPEPTTEPPTTEPPTTEPPTTEPPTTTEAPPATG